MACGTRGNCAQSSGKQALQMLTSLLLCLVLLAPVAQVTAQQFDAAVETAIELSVLESRGNSNGLYRELHPDAKDIVSKRTVAGWYETEFFPLAPQPIQEILSVQYIDWTWGVTGTTYSNTAEITFVQPFGVGSSQYLVTETVRLVQNGSGDWNWFFGRSKEFVDQQQALHDPQQSQSKPRNSSTRSSGNQNSGVRSNRSSRNQTKSTSNTTCTLVELAPGYPGYRGYVTGISRQWGGLGDWDCLETLERNNPGFEKAKQDRLNLEAARSLGINDDPSVWLWENWMAIEAQRGLPTSCYACHVWNPDSMPINTNLTQDWNDPRIMAGFADSRGAVDSFLPTAQMRGNFYSDYVMRAHAFFIVGPNANAIEVISVYESLAEGQEQYWYAFSNAGPYVFEVGGYTYVTPSAYPEDQVFSVAFALDAMFFQHPPYLKQSIANQWEVAVPGWRSELLRGSDIAFVEYLKTETTLLD